MIISLELTADYSILWESGTRGNSPQTILSSVLACSGGPPDAMANTSGGVKNNVAKSKTVTFQTGTIISGMSQELFGKLRTGEGAIYQEHLGIFLTCPYCGVEMTVGSLIDHFQLLHVTKLGINWDRLLVFQN